MFLQIDPVTRHERCSDDESDSYPWIGYHCSSIRRAVCLALGKLRKTVALTRSDRYTVAHTIALRG